LQHSPDQGKEPDHHRTGERGPNTNHVCAQRGDLKPDVPDVGALPVQPSVHLVEPLVHLVEPVVDLVEPLFHVPAEVLQSLVCPGCSLHASRVPSGIERVTRAVQHL